MENSEYLNFVLFMLQLLEPTQFLPYTLVFFELESVDEAHFIMSGQIDVGYQINHISKYKLRFRGNFLIGCYEICFGKRSELLYRTKAYSYGYFVRKRNWKSIEKFFPEFYSQIKKHSLLFYINKIRRFINRFK